MYWEVAKPFLGAFGANAYKDQHGASDADCSSLCNAIAFCTKFEVYINNMFLFPVNSSLINVDI